MLSEKMAKSLNEQHNREIYSGYFYLGMSAYAASSGLSGFAHWFFQQWKEELIHAKKFMDYIIKRKNRLVLLPIEEPPQDFSSGEDLFNRTLNHERNVSKLIAGLVEMAKDENDRETCEFLQWFVKEQVEEETTPAGILKKIRAEGKDEKALSAIDCQLAGRK
ncbi:MAG: ferritin [Omnitrophica bacterium]|nr:ferritin [Candidatus Omnitrophota bacterium]